MLMMKSRECQGGGYNKQTRDFNPGTQPLRQMQYARDSDED